MRRTELRLVAATAAALVMLALLAVPADASGTAVGFQVATGNSSALITYTVNRSASSIASIACSLAGPSTSTLCGAPAGSTKSSSSYQVNFANLQPGVYVYGVKVTLTDGEKATGATGFVITKPVPRCTVKGYAVSYDGVAHTATGTCTGTGGVVLSGLNLSATTHTNVGNYPLDVWMFTDSSGHYSSVIGIVSDQIAKAKATCVVKGYSVVYDTHPHTATGTCTGLGGVTLAGLNLSGTTHTNVGSYPRDAWVFNDSSGHYSSVAGTVSDQITKAVPKPQPTCKVTGYAAPYNGSPQLATGTCTGAGGVVLSGLDLSGTSHTNVGSFTDAWTFTDSTGTYSSAGGTVSDQITKATPNCSVSGYSVPFDTNPHTATGSCAGVGSAALGGLDLSNTSHTSVGSFTDGWTFTDTTGNYSNAGGTVSDQVTPATPNCSVVGYSVPVDTNSHTATGSCTGVAGVTLGGLDLTGTAHSAIGVYSDTWSFHDSAGDYSDASGLVSDQITKLVPDCSVVGYSHPYDGTPAVATGTCTGAGGAALAGLNLDATTHTDAGNYTDAWTFIDSTGEYADASGTVPDQISPIDPDCVVTGYNLTADGNPHTALGSCTGAGGVTLPGLDLDLSGTTHTDVGSYPTDPWTFTDPTGDYNPAAGTVDDEIATSGDGGGGGGGGGGGCGVVSWPSTAPFAVLIKSLVWPWQPGTERGFRFVLRGLRASARPRVVLHGAHAGRAAGAVPGLKVC